MEIDVVDWKRLAHKTIVTPGSTVDLTHDFDPSRKDHDLDKADGLAALDEARVELESLQDRFFAQSEQSMLLILQAIDAAGKDGTVKHVMSGMNPSGVDVYSFKAPSATERAHDYLWRHQLVLPELGRIAVFNRSHYENVTVTRVHPELLWPKSSQLDPEGHIWHRRYREINDWERYLTDNGTVIVKLFLNVSYAEQGRRFLERIDRPEKNWKFSPTDLAEREHWDAYSEAFSAMLTHTSTEWAPWHVIPADHKWFSHLSTFAVLLETLRSLDPNYPEVSDDVRSRLGEAKEVLTKELGISD